MIYKQKFHELLELVKDEGLSKADLQWKALDLKSEAIQLENEQADTEANKEAEQAPKQTKTELFNEGRKI